MARLRNRGVRILLILSMGLLAGGDIECDLDDGELEIDLDGIRLYDDYYYDDYYYDEVYYEDVWYDPWWGCCW